MSTEPRGEKPAFHLDPHAQASADGLSPAQSPHPRKRPSVAGSKRVRPAARERADEAAFDKADTGERQAYVRPLDETNAQSAHGEAAPTHATSAAYAEPSAGEPTSDADFFAFADRDTAAGAQKNTQAHGAEQQQHYIPLWDDAPVVSPRITRRLFIAGGAAVVAGAALFGIPAIRSMMPIAVTVNGERVELSGAKTLQSAYEKSGIRVTPGNLVDIEGEVIAEDEGTPYIATIDGQEVNDADTPVADGNALAFADGTDIEEPSVTEDKTVEANPVESGHGPIHAVASPGASGVSTVKTGQTSGKEVVLEVIEPAQDRLYLRSYPDTGGDKAIALTFDDGPWEGSTAEILDILRDNGAAATFFTVGQRIAGAGVDLVKRAYDEGHQICTHSWDHASGSGQGVNLSFMSVEEQRNEIEQGIQAIADATGAQASRVIRAPGGNFPLDVWRNVDDLIEADIGWDIDTLDWKRPGAGKIADQLKRATPGDIILMHDGGGDRTQTAEALRKALPYLKEQGFRFITIDEMMRFPRKEG